MPKHKPKPIKPKTETKPWLTKKKTIIILSAIVAVAVIIRVIPQMDIIFQNGEVMFRGVDSWYHMRLADAMVKNFPELLLWDYYTIFPSGMDTGYRPLMTWLIAAPSLVGADYEAWGAVLPVIGGAGTVVVIYFLTKELLPKFQFAPVIAAVLAIMLPSEFLHRSLLGFTDHHVLEVLFTALTLLFLVLALKRNWKFSIGAGISLGLLSLAWYGVPLLVLAIAIFFIIAFFLKAKQGEPTSELVKIISITGIVSLAMSAPIFYYKINGWLLTGLALLIPAIFPWILEKLREAIKDFKVLLGTTIIIIVGCLLTLPERFGYPLKVLFRGVFWGFDIVVGEGQVATPDLFLNAYGVAFFLAIVGIVLFIKDRKDLMFSTWAITMFAATGAQRRWGYYLIVAIAIFAAYAIYRIANWIAPNARKFAIVVMCLFAILPSIRGTIGVVTLPNNLTPDWVQTLTWVRENTPNPFPSDDIYYQAVQEAKPSYSVMAWWDYGHWVTRIARRVPTANPILHSTDTHGRRGWEPSSFYYSCTTNLDFFASETLEETNKAMEMVSGRYVILDSAIITGKFYAIGQTKHKSLSIDDAIIYDIWMEQIPEYKLIFQTPTIKVFEWTGYQENHRYQQ